MAGARARQMLSPDSAFAGMNPLRWIHETYANLITERGVYCDFRVSVKAIENENELMQIGGIWHTLSGAYLSKAEADALEWPVETVWWMNKPQVKLFSLLPLMFEKDRDIPLAQIQARGGRRSGKTEGGVRMALAIAAMLPYSKIGVFGMDYKSNHEMLLKIVAIMPQSWYANYDQALNTLYLRNGSSVIFFSQKNYKKAGRSYSFDFILLDELPTYDNSGAVMEGCRGAIVEYDGVIMSIYTPPPQRETCYWEEQKSRSPDPELSLSVKTLYFGSSYDNITLSEKAKRKIKLMSKNMSNSEYEREILGKWSRSTGVVFYDFKRETHVVETVPPYLVDITREYCRTKWGEPFDYICGMDFNESPMQFTAYKLYWDPAGGTMICHANLSESDTNTEKFIYSKILPWLRGQYPGIKLDADLAKQVAIIADASSWWQGTGAKTHRDAVTPAHNYLHNAGFTVYRPKAYPKRTNTKRSNVERFGGNPIRIDRMESFRGRLFDRFNQAHVLFLSTCPGVIDSIENIPLANGQPDYRSDYAHAYDAASYPVYNLYPRLQLSTTDPATLTLTYSIVHDIGQKELTPEQRNAHPMTQTCGSDLVT
jgi:hypothetical protein